MHKAVQSIPVILMAAQLIACGDAEPPRTNPDGWNLQVANHLGPVTVRAVKGQQEFKVNTSFSGPDAESAERDVRLAQSFYKREGQVLVDAPGGNAPDVTVAVEVLAPEGTFVQVQVPGHFITLEGLEAGADADTTDGTIMVSNVAGPLSLRSQRGDILIQTRVAEDLLQAQSDQGSIELSLPRDTNASFSALAVGGKLTLEGITLDGFSTPNAATGQFGGHGGRIQLQSHGGNITVIGE